MDDDPDVGKIRQWIVQQRVGVLNVAGPRESQAPGIQAKTKALLSRLLGD
jgi:hypothetical protein